MTTLADNPNADAQNHLPTEGDTALPSETEPVELTAMPIPARGSGLVTRRQAAEMLGVSVSTLRRRENEFKPVIVGGVHMFEESIVRRETTTIRRRAALDSLGPSAGETAAAVFRLLEEHVSLQQIVIQLRILPSVVRALEAEWREMAACGCEKCGTAKRFVCLMCLKAEMDEPCHHCPPRKCEKCETVLGKNRYLCPSCGTWSR
ncbi:MAG: helix-turn-helix domain-containing protein [Polyangiaceae bacterium]|nr:helix-turn-helix domain-containing protein [Polyangiaceae bacterium]